jgi:sec-independent protein translocase protein TatB
MFGLGGTEVVVIFVLALLLFGPKKLPEIGRTFGKTLAEFRRATLDFRVNLEREVELDKLKSESLGPIRDIVGLGEPRASVPPPVPLAGLNLPPAPVEPEPSDNAETPVETPTSSQDDSRDRQA